MLSFNAGIWTLLVSHARKAPKSWKFELKLYAEIERAYQKKTFVRINYSNENGHLCALAFLISWYYNKICISIRCLQVMVKIEYFFLFEKASRNMFQKSVLWKLNLKSMQRTEINGNNNWKLKDSLNDICMVISIVALL